MKILHVYTKEVNRTLGWVADFCPVEREVTCCRIESVQQARFLTFIPIDRGSVVRRERICCSCAITIPNETRGYRALTSDRTLPLAALEAATNPGISEENRDLIELAREVQRGGSVDPDLKRALLKEQFAWLDRIAAQHWRGETKLDRTSVVMSVGSLVVFFGGLAIPLNGLSESRRLDAIGLWFGFGLLLFIANAVVFFLAPRRALRQHVLPILAIALRPLNPSASELNSIMDQMRAEGFHYATRIKSVEVLQILRREPDRWGRAIG